MSEPQMFPRWLRFWHWWNAAMFLALVVTGFSLHFAGSMAGVDFRWAVLVHNATGLAIVIGYVFYIARIFTNGHWRQYIPRRPMVPRMIAQVRYYVQGIFRGAHHPFAATVENRFNPLQQIAYLSAMFVFFPLQAVTGVFLLFPNQAPSQVAGLGGLWPMAIGHSVAAYLFTSFLVVHVYLALTAGEAHTGVRAMVLGDQPHEEHPSH